MLFWRYGNEFFRIHLGGAKIARTRSISPDRLLEAARGQAVVTVPELESKLGVSQRTLYRRLGELVAAGELHQPRPGLYSREPSDAALGPEAQAIVDVIADTDADAHLTGYDVLAGYAHQFTYEYPHLVYCHPPHASALSAALSEEEGLFVIPAGKQAVLGPQSFRTVVLRKQPQSDRYPVREHIAAPEKAWVDLLREVRRSGMPFDYGELGRILNNMLSSGCDVATLRAYARRTGYLGWLEATLGETPAQSPELAQLAFGYGA